MAGADRVPVAGASAAVRVSVAVWAQWRRWRDKRVWAEAMLRLHRVARAGRTVAPSLLMLEAQTV